MYRPENTYKELFLDVGGLVVVPVGKVVIDSRASPSRNKPHFSALEPGITPPTTTKPKFPFPKLYSIRSSPKPPTRDIGILTVFDASNRSASSIPLFAVDPCPNFITFQRAAISSTLKSTRGFPEEDKGIALFGECVTLATVEEPNLIKESQFDSKAAKITADSIADIVVDNEVRNGPM